MSKNKYELNDCVYVIIRNKIVALKVAAVVEKNGSYRYNLIRFDSTTIKHPRNLHKEELVYASRDEARKWLTAKIKKEISEYGRS